MQSQLEHCRQYLSTHRSPTEAANAWLYQDEGFSGAALHRPAMQRLLQDIRARLIHCVVCYRLDRMSRSVSDFSSLMQEFAKYQVSFLCASEEFDTEKPMGRAMLYIASVFSQLERETIAERVRDNMYTLAMDGRWLGGTPPYGYRIQRSKPPHPRSVLCAVTEEVTILQTMFGTFLQTDSLCDTAQALTGFQTRQGHPFTIRYLRALLRNPMYAAADAASIAWLTAHGYVQSFPAFQHTQKGLMVFGKHPNQHRTDNAPVLAIGTHDALVCGTDWCRIQQQLDDRQPVRNRSPIGLLRGWIQCARCGSPMQCKRRSGRQGQFDYICRKKLRDNACSCPNLVGKTVDDAIWAAVAGAYTLPLNCLLSLHCRRKVMQLCLQDANWNGCQLTVTLRPPSCFPDATDFRRS